MKKFNLLSLNITLGAYPEFLDILISMSKSNQSSYTCVANVHMLVEAYKDKQFADLVNSAELVTPDGMPLAKGIQLLYGKKQDRVAGMDLLPDLLRISEKDKLKVLFYGGTQDMLENTKLYCERVYPDLSLAGLISPPFRVLSMEEEDAYIAQINSSGANFVFVALGCPKQEKWMAAMKGRINACMIGIGGALPVLIGMQKRAPKWMQDASLEWLFRFTQEPKRLFKRYFHTNSLFLFLFTRKFLKTKLKIANS
ncbi:WecB/TagA/CpsF family glycosyltransferase [Christiangramia echinicola]|uniref:N-acetylglucosaminyldiphosphoundecaprenol N-acetyl-beta-D-mannosaminyltransferase n=1 Tax=Christiangramia echinicola TaxID=279359 RepID=A0A1H1LUC1_9FLAO|nr:WecB/TagA/CpsF family glycosyltransferase [Christiangramia echinicola]SDR77950.1 N-acetylglucosaminyldiphosphoundecaprenol N-acetyl-beta-D-mannosaminyltransferase [Christiangramia echinicola]